MKRRSKPTSNSSLVQLTTMQSRVSHAEMGKIIRRKNIGGLIHSPGYVISARREFSSTVQPASRAEPLAHANMAKRRPLARLVHADKTATMQHLSAVPTLGCRNALSESFR